MRLLARNWKQQQELERADQLYQRAYCALRHTDDETLASIALLQDWAILKLGIGEQQAARELTEKRVMLARNAYETGKSSSDLLIFALKFQADILESLDLVDAAEPLRRDIQVLSDLDRLARNPWMFEQVSQSLWPPLEDVAREVRNRDPQVKVNRRSMNPGDSRFEMSIRFSKDVDFVQHIEIVLSCSVDNSGDTDNSFRERWRRRTCRSQVIEASAGNSRILRAGPRMEFELGDNRTMRQKLDDWIAATATFVQESTRLTVESYTRRVDSGR